MKEIPQAFKPMTEYKQFILWKTTLRNGKKIKLPISAKTGKACSTVDHSAFVDHSEIVEAAAKTGMGVGFVFTDKDPFWFVDIDKCIVDGKPNAISSEIYNALPGAALELSQSRTGYHLFGTGSVPGHACKNSALGIELYTKERFVALTGIMAQGSAATDCSHGIAKLAEKYFPVKSVAESWSWTTEPVPEWNGPTEDEVLINKACSTSNGGAVFGAGVTFADIWTRNVDKLALKYPDTFGGKEYDESQVDAALAQHLAFWTGANCQRMYDLMHKSAIKRDKWERESYLRGTIERACSLQEEFYNPKPNSVAPESEIQQPSDSKVVLKTGLQYMTVPQQLEHFKDCFYIRDAHRILTSSGMMLKSEQFRATFGGFLFDIDAMNDKNTKNAWEVFTESQAIVFPKVDMTCFRPDLPFGEIVEKEGRALVNAYLPVEVDRAKGDVSPFLEHLNKILPNRNDSAILLAYMAACVQHKGVKFQWAPLLQGCEGNGKTLFTRCVSRAIGKRYTHFPKAADIDNKFNSWLLNKLFIGVEDIFVPSHRREVIETLKPMITGGDGIEIQFKGQDQITADICANFLLNSNHKDAIAKTRTDRRFAVFYTAQQEAEDLTRDGMGGDYFPKLYSWCENGGYAIISEYLATYKIPDELNPATKCHRAPRTSSTEEAIKSTLGVIEQEILEAVHEGREGFCGGWISSMKLNELIENTRGAKVSRNKRSDILKALGYSKHPNLTNGRANTISSIDNGRPTLYVKKGSPQETLECGVEILREYEDSQRENGKNAIEEFGL